MYVIGVLSLDLIDTARCVFVLVAEGSGESAVGHVNCMRSWCDVDREMESVGVETGRIEGGKMVESIVH